MEISSLHKSDEKFVIIFKKGSRMLIYAGALDDIV